MSAPRIGLIHGWAMHGGLFGRLCRAWPEPEWIRLDLPGHGQRRRQPWPEGPTWLLHDLERQVPEGAWLAGWSLGGLIAMQAALARPGRYAGLVLIAATPCFVSRPHWPFGVEPEMFQAMAAELSADARLALNRFFALEVHGSDNAREELKALKRLALAHGPPDPAALAAGLEHLAAGDLSGRLAELDLPVLLVGGERDRLVARAALEETARRLPRVRVVRIPGATHAPFLTSPEAVAGEIRAFIREPAA